MHSMLWLQLLPNTLSFPKLFTRIDARFYLNLLKAYLAFKDGSKVISSSTVSQLCNSLSSEPILYSLFSINFMSFIFIYNIVSSMVEELMCLFNFYTLTSILYTHSEYSIHVCQIKSMIC